MLLIPVMSHHGPDKDKTGVQGSGKIMNRWSVLGVIGILVGLVILIIMWGFIVTIVVTLLKLIVVAVGIILILAGIAAILFGGRRRMRVIWGPSPTNT